MDEDGRGTKIVAQIEIVIVERPQSSSGRVRAYEDDAYVILCNSSLIKLPDDIMAGPQRGHLFTSVP